LNIETGTENKKNPIQLSMQKKQEESSSSSSPNFRFAASIGLYFDFALTNRSPVTHIKLGSKLSL